VTKLKERGINKRPCCFTPG